MQHFYNDVHGFMTDNHLTYFSKIITVMPENAQWVEVGSWQGKSISYCVVESINRDKKINFHCVDTWQGSEEHQEFDVVKNNQLYDTFIANIQPIKEYVKIYRMPSVEASEEFEDESLDFVFIDAAHDYDNVMADLDAWFPKIKTGGILGVDDYKPKMSGVWHGLNDFIENNKLSTPTRTGRACYLKK
jgi:hypothetical protein